MCHVLQYVSSIAGLAILAIWYFRLPTPTAESLSTANVQEPLPGRAAILTVVIAAACAIGGYIAVQAALAGASNYRVIYLLLTRGIAWFGALYTMVGALVTFGRRKPEPLPET
jgi:heme A synthase